MQIGGLGFIHSIAASKQTDQTSSEGGFANLLSSMSNTIMTNDSFVSDNDGETSPIKELITFLQSSDLTSLSNVPLESESFSDVEEIVKLIQNLLKIEDSELKSSISSFLENMNLEGNAEEIVQTNGKNSIILGEDVVDSNLLEFEIAKLIEELPKMETEEAFMAFVQVLPLIPMEGVMLKNDEQFSVLVKSLKLFELLSKDSNQDNILLKQFLKEISEKLELFTKLDHSSSRKENLMKIFTPVIKGLQNETNSNLAVQSENKLPEQAINKVVNENGFTLQQMSKPEQFQILNSNSGKPVSAEGLIKQFEAILSKGQLLQTGGNQKLFIKLYPEHLGALRVELIQQEQGMIARLMTSTTAAKEILESQLQNLRHAFSSQNIQIERIEISSGLNNPDRFINKDPEQQEQKGQQHQEERKLESDQSFTTTLEETLLNIEV